MLCAWLLWHINTGFQTVATPPASYECHFIASIWLTIVKLYVTLKEKGSVVSFSIVSNAMFIAGTSPLRSLNTPRWRTFLAFPDIGSRNRMKVTLITIIRVLILTGGNGSQHQNSWIATAVLYSYICTQIGICSQIGNCMYNCFVNSLTEIWESIENRLLKMHDIPRITI